DIGIRGIVPAQGSSVFGTVPVADHDQPFAGKHGEGFQYHPDVVLGFDACDLETITAALQSVFGFQPFVVADRHGIVAAVFDHHGVFPIAVGDILPNRHIVGHANV